MKIDERTLQMKKSFIDLHNNGLSIKEIAEKFDLHPTTVYGCLGEIAEEARVSRESLLRSPHDEHGPYERRFEPVEPVDPTEFEDHFNCSMAEIENMRQAVKKQLKKQERIAQSIETEEEEWRKY